MAYTDFLLTTSAAKGIDDLQNYGHLEPDVSLATVLPIFDRFRRPLGSLQIPLNTSRVDEKAPDTLVWFMSSLISELTSPPFSLEYRKSRGGDIDKVYDHLAQD